MGAGEGGQGVGDLAAVGVGLVEEDWEGEVGGREGEGLEGEEGGLGVAGSEAAGCSRACQM